MATDTGEHDRASRQTLIRADYQDEEGRWWAVSIPEDMIDQPQLGLIIGPPDLSSLTNLPPDTAVRLHNELWSRGLLTRADLKRGGAGSIKAALQAAFRADFAAVTSLYI